MAIADIIEPVWHVVQVKPNGLDLARTNLARQGYDSLMPLQTVTTRTRRGLRQTRRALFPGYLFFNTGADNAINWRAVRNTRGVAAIVSMAGRPARLPGGYVEALRALMDGDDLVKAGDVLAPGDRVRVVNGPMTGWVADVMAADEAGRIQMLIDVMGRAVKSTTARRNVERLD